MLKPRLMNPQFVQKVIQEKNDKIFQLKHFIHSKHFYVFLFVLGLCLLLFLVYRYFDKKNRMEEMETNTQSLEKEEMESQNIEDDYNEDDEIGATPIQQIKGTSLEDKSTYIPNHVQRENDMINLDEYDNMDVQEIQF